MKVQIKNFSYTIKFKALNAINVHISLIVVDASMENKHIFINDNINKESNESFESTERNLAAYLFLTSQ
ncbi:TPA: hypothetical protein ACP687_003374 [Escherichia coli]